VQGKRFVRGLDAEPVAEQDRKKKRESRGQDRVVREIKSVNLPREEAELIGKMPIEAKTMNDFLSKVSDAD